MRIISKESAQVILGLFQRTDNKRKENMIMNKIRMSFLFLLVVLSLFCLTACGSNTDNSPSNTSTTQATSGSQAGSGSTGMSGSTGSGESNRDAGNTGPTGSAGTGAAGETGREESTGVFGGIMEDVEDGVDNLTGEDASRASDESK